MHLNFAIFYVEIHCILIWRIFIVKIPVVSRIIVYILQSGGLA